MKLRNLAAALAFTVLAGCAQMGMQTPTTFNARVAAAYTTVTAVAEGTKAAFTAKKISAADRDNVVASERTALAAIDVANQIHATNPQAGEDKLTATLAILNALNAYVIAQGNKP